MGKIIMDEGTKGEGLLTLARQELTCARQALKPAWPRQQLLSLLFNVTSGKPKAQSNHFPRCNHVYLNRTRWFLLPWAQQGQTPQEHCLPTSSQPAIPD